MSRLWKPVFAVSILVFVAQIFTSCGSSSSTDASKVSGVVQLGVVDGATVTVYKLNEDGSRGDEVAKKTSGSDGTYGFTEGELGTYEGAAEIVATGGTYVDEATGKTISRAATDEVRQMVPGLDATTLADYGGKLPITALSDVLVERCKYQKQPGFDWKTARSAAKDELKTAYAVDLDAMPYNPKEAFPSATDDRAKLTLVLAGIAEAAEKNGVDHKYYMQGLAQDVRDGKFDGKIAGTAVTFPSGAAFPTAPLTEIKTGMGAWNHLPPGISGTGDLPVTAITFEPAPPNKFDDISGYFATRDKVSGKYSQFLDPYNAKYIPTIDSYNGAAYSATYDPCNSASSNYDLAKCPTNQAFNVNAFNSFKANIPVGTYDPKKGTYTSPDGKVFQPGAGGQFVNPDGAAVPPPNTDPNGGAYTGAFTPGTTCAAGTFYDAATKACKAPTTGGKTCTPPQFYDFPSDSCKTFVPTTKVMTWTDRLQFASMQIGAFFKRLFN